MDKFYTVNFKAIGTTDDTLQGNFNPKTVVEEVKEFLTERYGAGLQWFTIEDDEDKIVYDSRKKKRI